MGKHRDWSEIEKDYRENGLNYAELAEKYEVSISTLKKAAARQGWTQRKEKKISKALKKAEAVILPKMELSKTEPSKMEPEEMELSKMEPGEIVVYDKETRAQRFDRLVDGMADRIADAIEKVDTENAYALKLLTVALKDLRDLQRLNKDALDIEEQQARIAKLRSDTRIVESDDVGGIIILPEIDEKPQPPEDEA